jgi:hypothetical protein
MAEVDGRAADRDATRLMSVTSTDREPNQCAVLALLSVAQRGIKLRSSGKCTTEHQVDGR